MQATLTQRMDAAESAEFLQRLEADWGAPPELDPDRHLLRLFSPEGQRLADFRPPLVWPRLPEQPSALPAYLSSLPEAPLPHLLVLVQLGSAALGYSEGGELLLHKVVKKYVRRQKQGRSQINYLKTRGKSKAGSRVRLANTIAFFDEVNERLGEWMEENTPERILVSCTEQVWGLMFQAEPLPPFDKKDPRLADIPTQVREPRHEELLRIHKWVQHGRLYRYEEGPQSALR
jgi:hypothetical protein